MNESNRFKQNNGMATSNCEASDETEGTEYLLAFFLFCNKEGKLQQRFCHNCYSSPRSFNQKEF